MKYTWLVATLLLANCKAICQQQDIVSTILRNNQKINTQYPILDSLNPYSEKAIKGIAAGLNLTQSEVRQIHHNVKQMVGTHLIVPADVPVRLLSAMPYFHALKYADSASLSFISKNKPFYSLSQPVFFDDRKKAIIDIELIGRQGYTILMALQDGHWVIEKEYVRWVS